MVAFLFGVFFIALGALIGYYQERRWTVEWLGRRRADGTLPLPDSALEWQMQAAWTAIGLGAIGLLSVLAALAP